MATPDLTQTVPAPLADIRPGPFRPRRLVLIAALATLALAPGDLGALTRPSMQGAIVQVSAFVAATFLPSYGLEKLVRFDMGFVMGRTRAMQAPIAALLGASPGCGGAVVVVAAYASGQVSLGAVVATLTAPMGDAAVLLLATRPDAALVLMPIRTRSASLPDGPSAASSPIASLSSRRVFRTEPPLPSELCAPASAVRFPAGGSPCPTSRSVSRKCAHAST